MPQESFWVVSFKGLGSLRVIPESEVLSRIRDQRALGDIWMGDGFIAFAGWEFVRLSEAA